MISKYIILPRQSRKKPQARNSEEVRGGQGGRELGGLGEGAPTGLCPTISVMAKNIEEDRVYEVR